MNAGRIYRMDNSSLTEEQIAVAFARCSRNPEPFDRTAKQVSETQAARFNEKWVLGDGHASVAEHAITHIAIENISRLCADHIESGRLASYTEKSSRYQAITPDHRFIPPELAEYPDLLRRYEETTTNLMLAYRSILNDLATAKQESQPQLPDESGAAWQKRRIRESLDDARALLPAATLTSLGLTANARSLAYLISRMASSPLAEDRQTARGLHTQGTIACPSLLKHAEPTTALQRRQQRNPPAESATPPGVRLLHFQQDAEQTIAESLRESGMVPTNAPNRAALQMVCAELGAHDQLPREFELADYRFTVTLDYGAMRELRRHRMLTFLESPLTALDGHNTPDPIADSDLSEKFETAINQATELYRELLNAGLTAPAQYAVCHAHWQTVTLKLNLRQLRNLARLRTQPKAHIGIRRPVQQMLKQVRDRQSFLYRNAVEPVVADAGI